MASGNGQAYVYIGMAAERGVGAHGLWRKETGDGEWSELTSGLPQDSQVRGLALDPQDSSVVVAATHTGVYRSADHGDHWDRLDLPEKDEPVWTVMFHPGDPQVMFAGYNTPEIYRSDDRGESWRPLTVDVRFPSITERPKALPKRIIGMSADPNYPDEIYAAIEVGGLIRSLDGGESWEGVIDGFYVNDDPVDTHGVLASGTQPHKVHAITRIGMFRSTDRGDHWEHVDIEKLGPNGTYCRSLRQAPDDPSTLYLAAGAAFKSEVGVLFRSRDEGQTWDRIDLGFAPKSTMFAVAINAAQPSQIYCSTGGGEVFGSHDGGESWNAYPLRQPAQDVRALVCG